MSVIVAHRCVHVILRRFSPGAVVCLVSEVARSEQEPGPAMGGGSQGTGGQPGAQIKSCLLAKVWPKPFIVLWYFAFSTLEFLYFHTENTLTFAQS